MKKNLFILLGLILAAVSVPMACSKSPTGPATPTPGPNPTATNWAGYTSTPTFTPTATGTLTVTPTITATNFGGYTSTFTITSSMTPTYTPITYTPTNTPTSTNTSTTTNTVTPTNTITGTWTFTATSTYATSIPVPTGTPLSTGSTGIYPPNGLAASVTFNGSVTVTTIYVAVGDGITPGLVEIFSNGVSQTPWNAYGSTAFGQPNGVAVNSSGDVYVLDQLNNAVYEFSSAGTMITSWNSWTPTSSPGVFNSPEGIAVDATGNVYVADTGNSFVEKFTSSGTLSNEWQSWSGGNITNSFAQPSAVSFDGSGNIYIADYQSSLNASIIDVFSIPGSYSKQWQASANSDIFGIAVNGSNLYAADSANEQLEQYDLSGNLLSAGSGPMSPSSPDGVIVLGSDLLVSDYYNNAIYNFIP